MSPKTRRDGLYAALPVLAFLSLSCFTARLWQSTNPAPERPAPAPAPAPAPPGRYTQSQILSRSAPLCRALSGHTLGLHLRAERRDGAPSEQSSGRVWDVYASDAAGRHVVYLKWNDDTGQVWVAGCPTGSLAEEAGEGPPLGRREAVTTGQEWLRLLWGSGESVPWRLVQVTGPDVARETNRWHLVWHAGRQRASISLDSRSGGLALAKRTRGV